MVEVNVSSWALSSPLTKVNHGFPQTLLWYIHQFKRQICVIQGSGKLLAVVVKETDFDTHSLKAVQTCLSLKGFPLNFPRTEVTSSSPVMGNDGSWDLRSIGLKSPGGNPTRSPRGVGFPFGIFSTCSGAMGGACLLRFFLVGKVPRLDASWRCRRVVMVLRGWVAK